MDSSLLFTLSARKSQGIPRRRWSPNVINPGCRTQPRCLHCKWECFKQEKRMDENRAPLDRVLARAERILEAGASRMLIAAGWTGYSLPDYYFQYVRALRERFDLELYGLFGSIDGESLRSLRQAGMDGYQCGLESASESVYRSFRPGGDSLADRIATLRAAKAAGLELWSGFIVGLGGGTEAAESAIGILAELGPSSVGVQPFIPFPGTALERSAPADPYEWARLMAIANLYLPGAACVSSEAGSPYIDFARSAGATWFPVFPAEPGRG